MFADLSRCTVLAQVRNTLSGKNGNVTFEFPVCCSQNLQKRHENVTLINAGARLRAAIGGLPHTRGRRTREHHVVEVTEHPQLGGSSSRAFESRQDAQRNPPKVLEGKLDPVKRRTSLQREPATGRGPAGRPPCSHQSSAAGPTSVRASAVFQPTRVARAGGARSGKHGAAPTVPFVSPI